MPFIGVAWVCGQLTIMDALSVDGCALGQCDYALAWVTTVVFDQYLLWFSVSVVIVTILLALLRLPARMVSYVSIGLAIAATIVSNAVFNWSLHAGD